MSVQFEIVRRDVETRARAGLLHTAHGVVETPAFTPVGTAATVKGMTQEMLEQLGVSILLANTYHLYLRPGHEVIRTLGGLHRFMSWPHPILTDSGGYQVMSLKGLSRVTEEGVRFRSHLDGSSHFLSPELAVEIQLALGADILMTLDECVEYPASHESARRAARLTGRWALRSKEHYLKSAKLETLKADSSLSSGARSMSANSAPALFGIVQGGTDQGLRQESAEEILEIGFEGYAIGGLSVGEPKSETYDIAEFTAALIPGERPRYLMGVGLPEDLVECVARGVDLFDCVLPTRNGRNGSVFTSAGKLNLRNARYAGDERPIEESCACPACRRYSRAYLRHLFAAGEMLAGVLATAHNLNFYLDTMRKIRESILSGNFKDFRLKVSTGA